MTRKDGGLAHMVERSLRMREARGSIPLTSTLFGKKATKGTGSPTGLQGIHSPRCEMTFRVKDALKKIGRSSVGRALV